MKKLWLLESRVGFEYDCAQAFVIRAETEEAARKQILVDDDKWKEGVNPEAMSGMECYSENVWLNPRLTSCTEIPLEGEDEVILRDFTAG